MMQEIHNAAEACRGGGCGATEQAEATEQTAEQTETEERRTGRVGQVNKTGRDMTFGDRDKPVQARRAATRSCAGVGRSPTGRQTARGWKLGPCQRANWAGRQQAGRFLDGSVNGGVFSYCTGRAGNARRAVWRMGRGARRCSM